MPTSGPFPPPPSLPSGTKLLLVGQLVQDHEAYIRALQRWVLDHDLTQVRDCWWWVS